MKTVKPGAIGKCASKKRVGKETAMSAIQNILIWILMIVLQQAPFDDLGPKGKIVFELAKEQVFVQITRLQETSENCWSFQADLYVDKKKQDSLTAGGCFTDEGMLLFSLSDSRGESLFSAEEAGAPLVLRESLSAGREAIFIYPGIELAKVKEKNDVDDLEITDTFVERYAGEDFSVTLIRKDRSRGRILYSMSIEPSPQNEMTFIIRE